MSIALRQHSRQEAQTDFPPTRPAVDAYAQHDVGALDTSGQERGWSFQRMIAVAGGISAVLWLGLGALVWKAISL